MGKERSNEGAVRREKTQYPSDRKSFQYGHLGVMLLLCVRGGGVALWVWVVGVEAISGPNGESWGRTRDFHSAFLEARPTLPMSRHAR